MFINIKHPLILNNDYDIWIFTCAVTVLSASYKIWSFNSQVDNCRAEVFCYFARNNTIPNGSLWQCNIPYEECRCSVISNKFNHTIKCITDRQVIIAHLSPLVLYASQLYIIYDLFSFIGKSSHFLRVLCWVIASLLFAFIITVAHDNTCLYYIMSESLTYSGVFFYAIFLGLFIISDIKDRTSSCDETSQKRRLVKDNHSHEVSIIVIVK